LLLALTRRFSKDAAMTAVDGSAPSIGDEPRGRGFAATWNGWSGRIEALADRERDQLPLWLPVGLGLGTAAWFSLPDQHAWTGFPLAAGAVACGAMAAAGGQRWGRALAWFALAAALGCGNIWWKSERAAAPRLEREQAARFEARVESVQPLAERDSVRLVVRPQAGSGLPPRLRANVPADKAPALRPGDAVRLRAWLMPPAPAAVPGAYDYSRAAWFQGIGGTGRVLDIERLPGPSAGGWSTGMAALRQRLGDHIASRLPGGEGGIAVALATGDQGRIGEDDAEAMRRAGLAHLLSVSGLHLTAVVGAVMLLTLKLLALSPALALRFRLTLWAAGAAAAAGIGYTLLTGAEVPTIRSCVAALLVLAGIALGREALTLRLVAVGALIVLLLWPESLAGPSFQLSFAAITAIVALHEHPKVRALLAKREEAVPFKAGRFMLGLVLTGLVVEAALTPIALYHFHRTGLYGALANIVAIPLTTFVVMPAEALALLFDGVGLGAPFWWAAGRALAFLLALAHRTAAAPGAVAMLPEVPDGAFALMMAGGLWLCLWRGRIRRWGAAPVLLGAAWALATPAPDVLVTGDGRHMAVRTDAGDVVILRTRAGDYVRDMLAESSGIDAELPDLDDAAACNPDACAATLTRGGRAWRLLAFRSKAYVETEELRRACAGADIVVAERRLPRACAPRWLKADAALLRRTGGLAIRLGRTPSVETVADSVGEHPWR
jgi:competence protein ComEC